MGLYWPVLITVVSPVIYALACIPNKLRGFLCNGRSRAKTDTKPIQIISFLEYLHFKGVYNAPNKSETLFCSSPRVLQFALCNTFIFPDMLSILQAISGAVVLQLRHVPFFLQKLANLRIRGLLTPWRAFQTAPCVCKTELPAAVSLHVNKTLYSLNAPLCWRGLTESIGRVVPAGQNNLLVLLFFSECLCIGRVKCLEVFLDSVLPQT